MKKVALFLLAGFLSAGAYAQQAGGLDAVMEQQYKKDKEKSDKDITDAKKSAKAATWLSRGKTYEEIAQRAVKLDSNAAMTAYEAYKKAAELDNGGKTGKEAQDALKGQGMYYAFMTAGSNNYQSKRFKDAAKFMNMAMEANPKDTTAALYTGIAAQQGEDLALAKSGFESYINNGGKDPSIYYALSSLYRQDKDIDKAIGVLDRGITALGGNKDLSAERVNILVNAGRIDDAMKGMIALAEKDPNNATNWLNIGILYDQNAQKASTELKKISDASRRSKVLPKQLAEQQDALKAMQGEVTRLTARAKKEPKNADVKRQLASVNQMITDKKSDIAETEKQMKEEAGQPQVENAEGKIAQLTKEQNENLAKALEYYQKALQIDPNNYDANFNMGVYYYNEAVIMKGQVDKMDMKEYQARGKEVEGRVCGKFKQALPYFLKAKSVKDTESDLNESLTNLQNILKQFEDNKIACIEPK
ncbi:tetratricopeptide repeat protein [Tellurirhabdus rosea]|uniref:tetratricopeptide repeat protein n=1 Tax=Tellurirhabdus rosea TaxID=2674997 RepID=UPI00224D8A4E|nr:tetratricopeptide repeat protein [Tellurirhabdus rosea]